MQFVGFVCTKYVDCLKNCLNDSGYQYWHMDKKSREHRVTESKANFCELKKSFERLNLREITLIGYAFKHELQQNYEYAQIVSKALAHMSSHKIANENKRFILIRLICSVWDRWTNRREGYGYVATSDLAKVLSQELASVPKPPATPSGDKPANIQEPIAAQIPKPATQPVKPSIPAKKWTIGQAASMPNVVQTSASSAPSVAPVNAAINQTPVDNTPKGSIRSRVSQYGNLVKMSSAPVIVAKPADLPEATSNLKPYEKYKNEYSKCNDLNKKQVLDQITTFSSLAVTEINSENKEDANNLFDLEVFDSSLEKLKEGCPSGEYQWMEGKGKIKYGKNIYDLKSIYPKPKNLEDLLRFLTDSLVIDLIHPKCIQAILDLMWFKNKHQNEALVDWLIKQETFGPKLLSQCLLLLKKKHEDRGSVSPYTISTLLLHYKNKGIYTNLEVIPTDDSIVRSVAMMIDIEPNNDQTTELVSWLSKRHDFHYSTFELWMEGVFFAKKLRADALYPARDHLIAKFFSQPAWWDMLVQTEEKAAFFNYIQDIILDKLWHENENNQRILASWIKNRSFVPEKFLLNCLKLLIKRHNDKGGTNPASLLLLLAKYHDHFKDDQNQVLIQAANLYLTLDTKIDEQNEVVKWMKQIIENEEPPLEDAG